MHKQKKTRFFTAQISMKNPTLLMTIPHHLWILFVEFVFFGKRSASLKRIVDFPNALENKTSEQTHHQTHQTRDVSTMVVYTGISHLVTLLLSI